jgi:hypothetical protein
MTAAAPTPAPTKPERRFRYNLRTLFLMVTLAAVLLSMACNYGVTVGIAATLGACLLLSGARKRRYSRGIFGMILLGLAFWVAQIDDYTTKKPDAAEVVGRYTLTSQTVSTGGLSVLQGRTCSIELRRNGTFSATNAPPDVLGSPGMDFFSTLLTVSGTWRIDVVAHGASCETTFWGICFDSAPANVHPACLIGRESPFGLVFTLGDPDNGQSMILRRAE